MSVPRQTGPEDDRQDRATLPGPVARGAGPGENGETGATGAGLVGGQVPEELVGRMAARLRSEVDGGVRVPWRRPWLASLVGSIVMVAALLVTMTLLGLML